INIADLIGRFIFSAAEGKKDEGAGQDGGGAPEAPEPQPAAPQ
ncbi:MAG: outer membrane lipid asymmetry maintenance protein MlaD, partial [Rhodospirillaceae bacterium]|nr:outer membrane lipid asymmetry maintenance protein MlaD [Rhodospirillaceae bacterium]